MGDVEVSVTNDRKINVYVYNIDGGEMLNEVDITPDAARALIWELFRAIEKAESETP